MSAYSKTSGVICRFAVIAPFFFSRVSGADFPQLNVNVLTSASTTEYRDPISWHESHSMSARGPDMAVLK